MILQPLLELQTEVNRLIIVGSRFANNDPRLQKLLPIFEKMGEKAPVFQKISGNIEALLKAPTTESAEHLKALSTLLYAVLYTQGKSIVEGEITEQSPMMNIDEVKTPLTYLELQPTIQALTTKGSGRYEVITTAFHRELIHDVRLYPYFVQGLADKNSDISEFIKEYIMPAVGILLIPFLLQDLTLDDVKINAERISALITLNYDFPDALIQSIVNSRKTHLQIALLPLLIQQSHYSELLVKLSQHKNKPLKIAMIKTIAKSQNTEIWQILVTEFKNAKNISFDRVLTDLVMYLSISPTLHGYDNQLSSAIISRMNDCMAIEPDNLSDDRLEDMKTRISVITQMLKIFINKTNENITEKLLSFNEFLQSLRTTILNNQHKYSQQPIKIISHTIDFFQVITGTYYGSLRLEESDPKFPVYINSINILDVDDKKYLINEMMSYKVPVYYTYHMAQHIMQDQDLPICIDRLRGLVKTVIRSPYENNVIPGSAIYNQWYYAIMDENYADIRWLDFFHSYCAQESFLDALNVDLQSFNTSYEHEQACKTAQTILATYAGFGTRDLDKINLLIKFVNTLPYERLGVIMKYLEESIGNAAHPIILKKIEAEMHRFTDPDSPILKHMNNMKREIAERKKSKDGLYLSDLYHKQIDKGLFSKIATSIRKLSSKI